MFNMIKKYFKDTNFLNICRYYGINEDEAKKFLQTNSTEEEKKKFIVETRKINNEKFLKEREKEREIYNNRKCPDNNNKCIKKECVAWSREYSMCQKYEKEEISHRRYIRSLYD